MIRLYAEAVQFGQLESGFALTQPQIQALVSCVGLISVAEEVTALVGREKEPSIHVHESYLRELFRQVRNKKLLRRQEPAVVNSQQH